MSQPLFPIGNLIQWASGGVTGPTVFSFVTLSVSRSFTFCNDGGHEKTQVECVRKWQIEDLDTWEALVDEK